MVLHLLWGLQVLLWHLLVWHHVDFSAPLYLDWAHSWTYQNKAFVWTISAPKSWCKCNFCNFFFYFFKTSFSFNYYVCRLFIHKWLNINQKNTRKIIAALVTEKICWPKYNYYYLFFFTDIYLCKIRPSDFGNLHLSELQMSLKVVHKNKINGMTLAPQIIIFKSELFYQ